jgi:hypothetical protein
MKIKEALILAGLRELHSGITCENLRDRITWGRNQAVGGKWISAAIVTHDAPVIEICKGKSRPRSRTQRGTPKGGRDDETLFRRFARPCSIKMRCSPDIPYDGDRRLLNVFEGWVGGINVNNNSAWMCPRNCSQKCGELLGIERAAPLKHILIRIIVVVDDNQPDGVCGNRAPNG